MNRNNHFEQRKSMELRINFQEKIIKKKRRGRVDILRKFACVNIDELKGHEEVNSRRMKKLTREIKQDKFLKRPIAVDKNTNVILDGHHRLEAIRKIGLNKIPVVFVDYKSPKIKVFSWGENKKLDKKLIIKAGLSGKKLPPKTSKHMIKLNGELVHISLLEKEANVPLEKLN